MPAWKGSTGSGLCWPQLHCSLAWRSALLPCSTRSPLRTDRWRRCRLVTSCWCCCCGRSCRSRCAYWWVWDAGVDLTACRTKATGLALLSLCWDSSSAGQAYHCDSISLQIPANDNVLGMAMSWTNVPVLASWAYMHISSTSTFTCKFAAKGYHHWPQLELCAQLPMPCQAHPQPHTSQGLVPQPTGHCIGGRPAALWLDLH